MLVTGTLGCKVTSDYTVQYSKVGTEESYTDKESVSVLALTEGTVTRLNIENRLPVTLIVDVLDISGRSIEQFTLPRGNLEKLLSGYIPGLYIYRISHAGTLMDSGKFVIL